MDKVELSEMIIRLREDLQKAQNEGQDKDLRFAVGEVELELQVTVTKEAAGGGGVKFWVYNANAQVKGATQSVQKIRLKLAPVGPDGKTPAKISDQRKLD